MKISLRLLPIALFFLFYALIQVSFTSLRYMQEREDEEETKVFQEIAADRFKRFLEIPHMMTLLGAEFLGQGNILKVKYEKYASFVHKANPELLGFNVVNSQGVIVRAFPDGPNARALGRVTQNLGPLTESLKKNETFFLSAPFRLFQEKQGFVFYVPIHHNENLQGWYSIVISSEAFIKKFALQNFVNLFNLVILDEETGLDYFATSIEPYGSKIFQKKIELYGRKILVKTWMKKDNFVHVFPWYFTVIMSFIFAMGSAFILKLYDQRKRARGQLDNISILLQVTSKEALNNMIDIHRELNELNLPEDEKVERLGRDIGYLSNLIEQIDLLQTMAHSREGLSDQSDHNFLDLLQNQLDHFIEVLERKKIKISYDKNELKSIVLKANLWLMENSVLSNVISHLLIYTQSDSTIKVEGKIEGQQKLVIFRAQRIPSMTLKTVTRRIEVAKKVLQLHDGDLKEEVTKDEIILTLICRDMSQ